MTNILHNKKNENASFTFLLLLLVQAKQIQKSYIFYINEILYAYSAARYVGKKKTFSVFSIAI